MKRLIELLVNNETYAVAVEPQTTLLEALRDHLGLTGTKEACGTGECGSCTVLVEGKPILSCLALAVDYPNQPILTIEGLSEGKELTSVQQAFVEYGAIQCGFCTPGMVLSTTALLQENPTPSEKEIRKALEGHLCRCTGYNKIMAAVNMAAKKRVGVMEYWSTGVMDLKVGKTLFSYLPILQYSTTPLLQVKELGVP